MMLVSFLSIILAAGVFSKIVGGQIVEKLPNLSNNVLPGPTIAGFSSGGAMAINLHVVYSSFFSGVGGFGCGFYYCTSGPRETATIRCYANLTTVETSISAARVYEEQGDIDPLSNLANSKAFFWTGTIDVVSPAALSRKNVDFYKNFTALSNIKFREQPAAHIVPTDDKGPICPLPSITFYGNCRYAGTYEMLSHLYGAETIMKPNGTVKTGEIVYFDQKEFTAGVDPESIGLDNTGFYYRPAACNGTAKCRMHFFLHGCSARVQSYLPIFMGQIGLYKLAEVNNIIMIFPRAGPNNTNNLQGCWDTSGHNRDAFATNKGVQSKFFKRILNRLYGLEEEVK